MARPFPQGAGHNKGCMNLKVAVFLYAFSYIILYGQIILYCNRICSLSGSYLPIEYFNDTTSIIERAQIDFSYRYSYCYSSTKMITSISNIKIIRYMEVYCNVDYS